MDCKWIRARIPSHIDGELSADEAREVTEHLENCSECSKFASADRTVVDRLKATVGSESAPEDFASRLRDALAAEPVPAESERDNFRDSSGVAGEIRPPVKKNRTAWGLLMAAAAAALLVTFGLPWNPDGHVLVSAMAAEHGERLSGKENYGKLSLVSHDAKSISGYLSRELGTEVALPANRSIPEKHGASTANCGGHKMGVVGCFCRNRGKAVTLFIVQAEGLDLTGLDVVKRDNREYFCGSAGKCRAVLWRKGKLFYSLVGNLESDDILKMARNAACSLTGQPAPADAKTSATYTPNEENPG